MKLCRATAQVLRGGAHRYAPLKAAPSKATARQIMWSTGRVPSVEETLSGSAAMGSDVPEGAVGYCEHIIMGWEADKVYSVVSDVAKYKQFLPWCRASDVRKETLNEEGVVVGMEAEIVVGFSLFTQTYVSKVELSPNAGRIKARLSGGSNDVLLDYLDCEWTFREIGGKTDVDFDVTFKFKHSIHEQLSGLVLSQVVGTMVSSFVKRLHALHGAPSSPLQVLPLRNPARHSSISATELSSLNMPDLLKLIKLT